MNSQLDKWATLFTGTEKLRWDNGRLDNDYCQKCRYCCGPQGDDEPFPMALLPKQIDANTRENFYMLNANTAFLGREGCKSLTAGGCGLPQQKRPVACGLFPLVLANGKIYLYKNCPASHYTPLEEMKEYARKAAAMLNNLSLEELRHISLDLSREILDKKYIDLEMDVFPPLA